MTTNPERQKVEQIVASLGDYLTEWGKLLAFAEGLAGGLIGTAGDMDGHLRDYTERFALARSQVRETSSAVRSFIQENGK